MTNTVETFFKWRRDPNEDFAGDTVLPRTDEPEWLPRRLRENDDVILIDQFDVNGIIQDIDVGSILDEPFTEDELGVPKERKLEQGFEKYAWYRPHHTARGNFGIYIRLKALSVLASKVNQYLGTLSPSSGGTSATNVDTVSALIRLALEILLQHEWFHHAVEVVGYYVESITNKECYLPYKRNTYKPDFPSANCIEESLANATVARSQRCSTLFGACANAKGLPNSPAFAKVVNFLAQSQPPAYQEFSQFSGNQPFIEGCDTIASKMVEASGLISSSTRTYIGELMLNERPPNVDSKTPDLPVYVVKR